MTGLTPQKAYEAFVAGKLTYSEYHRAVLQWSLWRKGGK